MPGKKADKKKKQKTQVGEEPAATVHVAESTPETKADPEKAEHTHETSPPAAPETAPAEGGADDVDIEENNSPVRRDVADAPELEGFAAGPLTAEEEAAARQVKEAYASFWANLKFKKGWDTPLFLQSEVDDLLDQAAEIVGRIRTHLDKIHPGFKMRMVEGHSHEYLWTQKEHPRVHPEAFVRELVHQTLRDANGYVEGLSEDIVNKYIDHVQGYLEAEDESSVLRKEVQLLRAKVQRQWKALVPLVNDIFSPATPLLGETQAANFTIVQLATYRELARALSRVQHHVSVLHEERSKRRIARSRTLEASHAAQSRFEEQVAKRKQLKAALHDKVKGHKETPPVEPAPAPEPEAGTPTEEEEEKEEEEEEKEEEEEEEPEHNTPEFARTISQGSEVEVKTLEQEDTESPALKKIEELVAQVNVRKSELDRLKGKAEEFEFKELVADPLQSQKTVKSLHERCKYLSLELERDLLKLDAIVGGEKIRPVRKQQVQNIQHMLEDVDSINKKLSGLETELLPAVEEEQAKLAEQKKQQEEELHKQRQAEEERRREEAKIAQQQQEEKERELQAQRASLAERWKQLKLQPKFDVQETRAGYQVSAYIPGMRKEDLEISTQGNTITLSGTRLPSRDEELAMGQVLQARGLPVDDQNLLRLGSGRFGRFRQQYSLPTGVDVQNIKASYDAGVFNVVIPRKVAQRSPMGYGRSPLGGGGFFDDRDFWW